MAQLTNPCVDFKHCTRHKNGSPPCMSCTRNYAYSDKFIENKSELSIDNEGMTPFDLELFAEEFWRRFGIVNICDSDQLEQKSM